MTQEPQVQLRFSDLSKSSPTRRVLKPSAEDLKRLAHALDVTTLRKVVLDVTFTPIGKKDWHMVGTLGATVIQPCVVTLEPVTTRIDEPIERKFVADFVFEFDGDEIEMPEDDTVDPLPEEMDLRDVLYEALNLAVPAFPRTEGAEVGELSFTEPGVTPLKEEDLKPFAGLAKLKETLQKGED